MQVEFLCKYVDDVVCHNPFKCWECNFYEYYTLSKETSENRTPSVQVQQDEDVQTPEL